MRLSISMRTLLSSLFMAALFSGCNNNSDVKGSAIAGNAPGATADTANFTTIQWIDSSKNFGKIEEGQKLEVSFRFKNTGDKPLIIERVQPSCGCTVAEQSKDPVAPGGEGQIKATFNSEGRSGINHKTLFVHANTKNSQSVQFEVEVEKKKQ